MKINPILSPTPEAIFFDADGTLYESEKLSYEASRLTALELHDFNLSWELFDDHVVRGSKTTDELLEMQGLVINPEHIQAAKRRHIDRLFTEQLEAMNGVLPFLEWCKESGVLCMVVSANRRAVLDSAIHKLRIANYFKGIVSVEDIDDKRKPDPYPYQLALSRAGIRDQTASLAIEDTAKGIASARSAGLACIGIKNQTNKPEDLTGADLIINDFYDLVSSK